MPDAARAVAVGAQPGPAATSKLSPPAPPAALLRRDRLLERLERALEMRLTSVTAGAGYGKSTLLAGFVAGRRCAWYGCTSEDASPRDTVRNRTCDRRKALLESGDEGARAVAILLRPGAGPIKVALRASAHGRSSRVIVSVVRTRG